jgi:hypothetical protein
MTAKKIVRWEEDESILSDGSRAYAVRCFDAAGNVVGEIDCEDMDQMMELLWKLDRAAV